jgi:hypothetical protein
MFPFSGDASHRAPGVVLSPDHMTVNRTTNCGGRAWARSDRGVDAGCDLVRWAVQLSPVHGGALFMVGVASAAFREYNEYMPEQAWFFEDKHVYADGQLQSGSFAEVFNPQPFAAGDVVTVELERTPGVDGVLRVRVAGKVARELRGLPRDGVLYPIVGMSNRDQSYTMVALPQQQQQVPAQQQCLAFDTQVWTEHQDDLGRLCVACLSLTHIAACTVYVTLQQVLSQRHHKHYSVGPPPPHPPSFVNTLWRCFHCFASGHSFYSAHATYAHRLSHSTAMGSDCSGDNATSSCAAAREQHSKPSKLKTRRPQHPKQWLRAPEDSKSNLSKTQQFDKDRTNC